MGDAADDAQADLGEALADLVADGSLTDVQVLGYFAGHPAASAAVETAIREYEEANWHV